MVDVLTSEELINRQAGGGSISRIRLIFAKEVMANLRSYKLPASFIVVVSMFLLSTYLLTIDFRQRLDDWTINQEAQQSPPTGGLVKYSLPDGSFFHSVGEVPAPPIQRPQPLSVFVKGMDAEMERSVAVGQRIGFGPRMDENPLSTLFDSPDCAFIVKVLISLLALFFSVDTVTREKEAGTLRALFANPIRRREILFGKAAGAFISLFVSLAAGYIVAIIYLYTIDGVLRDREDLVRILLIFALSCLYGLLFVLLGLLISTVSVRTKTAIVTALLAWGAIVLVLPNAAVLAAKVLFPAGSYNQLNARLYKAQEQIVEEELRSHPGARTIFEIPNAKQAAIRIIDEDKRSTDEYIDGKLRQIEQAKRLAVFSPAGAITFGASDLAGTGASAYRAYLEFLRSGRDRVVDALKQQWDLSPREGAALVSETLESVSAMQQRREPLRSSLLSAAPALVSLLVWTVILGTAAFKRFERYDVS
jgi:ABC-2 type transport system permease protein